MDELTPLAADNINGYRVINAKYPPIAIFDDVASPEEFEDLYAVQAITNPRLKAEVGDLCQLPKEEIPFAITGCGYAIASFTHVNPDGSRFSDGSFGLMYIASCEKTALAEVYYHQQLYWSKVPELHYERFVFKALAVKFDVKTGLDARQYPTNNSIYHPDDYSASRALGLSIKTARKHDTLAYRSVRHPAGKCYALFTPRHIRSIIQSAHFEMIWDGKLSLPTRLSEV